MRRAKLAAGSVPAGSLPTADSHSVPLCFVCDEPIKSHRLSTSLLAGRTQYTHSPLPTKIGGYIGDEFVVVVTPQDALCKHCMALINTMDRLELELRQHRYQLIQHLKTKYKLGGHTPKPLHKFEAVRDEEEVEESEVIELSDEEWTPNKRQRTDSAKHHRCTICNATYSNLNIFMAHLSRHKQQDKAKIATVSLLSNAKSSVSSKGDNTGQAIHFKCGCCSESFLTKEGLALHMQRHTGLQLKSKNNSSPSQTVNKLCHDNELSASNLKEDPPVSTPTISGRTEELTQQESPASVGVCSEEQKGRVCLLALLNNGICSDLSHRVPVTSALQSPSDNPEMKNVGKMGHASDSQTISITVSIPSVLNGDQVTEHRLSLPAFPNNSNSSNLLYPLTLDCASTTSMLRANSLSNSDGQIKSNQDIVSEPSNQSISVNNGPDFFNNRFDMPDLCDKTSEDIHKSQRQTVRSPLKLPVERTQKKTIPCGWISNELPQQSTEKTISVQSFDMPSLLDEDLEQNGDVNLKCIVPDSSLLDSLKTSDSETFVSTNKCAPSFNCMENVGNHLKSGYHSATVLSANSSQNLSDVVENIAIVNVASVQVNGDNFDAESIANDWFYSSEKEISSVLQEKNGNEVSSSDSGVWFVENENVDGKTLGGDSCNSHELSISNDSLINSQKLTTEDGICVEESETRNKIISFI